MTFNWYILWAALLAALVPLALIATRHELRKVRLRLVEELRTTLFSHAPHLPQLELVSARYRASSDHTGQTRQALVMIWTGGLFFFALCFLGFLLLLVPRASLLSPTPAFPSITYAFLWTTGAASSLEELARAVTIVAIAFLGGYVFQLRYLIRATLNQELGALAFVRATLQILQGMIVALVAYRVIYATGVEGSASFTIALGTAFIFGLFPNAGLARIAKAVRVRAKTVDEEALAGAKIVPLEVIDGIDAETAFRLEESNLYDVQNLAAINPVALYAESPFSLHQILDWVLQAQLCANVGPQVFAQLKAHRLRTVFDLERAVLARAAPPDYLRAIGQVLFSTASPEFRRSLGLSGASALEEEEERAEIDPDVVRHAVAVMLDDLHVHRLRALWRTMQRTTAGNRNSETVWLYDTGPLPGEPALGPEAFDKARRSGAEGESRSASSKPSNGSSASPVVRVKELDEA